ncbi:MAG: ATP-dependent helicase HrpB [Gammaproteobacteria bacterium]|nr:ATP-dependent helicase HrpB [Gammaproteobacteria bacterium]
MSALPIEELYPALRKALAGQGVAVIQAPPGAGKTTRVPLVLLDAPWLKGRKLVLLEPRRLAARAAANYMAKLLGEAVGGTVGYRIRMDTRVGPHTRIEVVTEGILTRLIQSDAALSEYGLVIFDEFHERSLHADLALALCLEARQVLRPDLRLAVMSATLDAAPVAQLLGDAPLLTSEGRSFPVVTHYQPLVVRERIEPQVANSVRQVLETEGGSLLVFLPGMGEIRRVASMLDTRLPADVMVTPLYGDLSQAQQEAAILPAVPGQRKVVLATSIAETSLTIEGVRAVVDAGLMRVPRFDPVSGMTRLTTLRVSQASADQRRGRAGRLEPGVCYRLWSAGERLQAQGTPEILQADLASLVLELALWGAHDASKLAWMDLPPAAALSQARALLQGLEALDGQGSITAHGRRLLELPLHPRLAHMVVRGKQQEHGWLACLMAALISERDILSGEKSADINLRLRMLLSTKNPPQSMDNQRVRRVLTVARDIARQAGIPEQVTHLEQAGAVLALAYPDRVARARSAGEGRYLLSGGRGAFLPVNDPLSASEWLAVAELDGAARDARIYLAAAVSENEIRESFAAQITQQSILDWDETSSSVRAISELRLGAIILETQTMDSPDPAQVTALLLAAIRRRGLDCLPWTPALRSWQARVLFLREVDEKNWPDISDEQLLASLETWLATFLTGRSRLSHLADLPLHAALFALLGYHKQQQLDELAPTHFTVPTGSRIPIDYAAGEIPVLAVRLQELFGLSKTPAIAGGRLPLLLHLLSPAHRLVQVTRDLAGFWRSSYADVRKDMKGRYPKHHWPEDPLSAVPTRRAKRRPK